VSLPGEVVDVPGLGGVGDAPVIDCLDWHWTKLDQRYGRPGVQGLLAFGYSEGFEARKKWVQALMPAVTSPARPWFRLSEPVE